MAEIDLSKINVLVVEDEAFMRDLTRRMLNEFAVKSVGEAKDGAEGLKYIMTAAPPVNLVILDLQMPTLDGFDFIKFVRNDPAIRDHAIPIIILTGNADMGNIAKAAEFGINGFLVKPVSKAALARQIYRALTKPPIDPARINE